jgi:hypothetical protein
MTTTVTVNGVSFNIPNDKVQHIVALLEAYKQTQTTSDQQVREVITSNPDIDGRSLIIG